MKFLAGTLVISSAFLFASAAQAECPANGLQTAVDIYAAVGKPGANSNVIASQMDAIAKVCASSPHVLKVAALTYHNLSAGASNAEEAYDRAATAWRYFDAMRDARRRENEAPVMVMAGQQAAQIDVYADDKSEETLFLSLIAAEMRSGNVYPDHRPVQPGEAPRACKTWDAIDAQNASWFVRKNVKVDIPPALNFIDRASTACADAMEKSVNARILGLRASALYELLKDNPKRPGAIGMLEKALGDSKRYFQIHPKGDIAYWSISDRDKLEALALEVRAANMGLPPEADWFKPGNPESPAVVRAIAAKLDEAWATDAPLGISGAYKTYRALIGDLYNKVMLSKNVVPARHALALAAKGHAEGTMRSAETKDLKAPPGFLWNWIDPSVQPSE